MNIVSNVQARNGTALPHNVIEHGARAQATSKFAADTPPNAVRTEWVFNRCFERFARGPLEESILESPLKSGAGQFQAGHLLPSADFGYGHENSFDVFRVLTAGEMPTVFAPDYACLAVLYIRLHPSKQASVPGLLTNCNLSLDSGKSRLLWDQTGYLTLGNDLGHFDVPLPEARLTLQIGLNSAEGLLTYAAHSGVLFVAVEAGHTLRIAAMHAADSLLQCFHNGRRDGYDLPTTRYHLADLQANARAFEDGLYDSSARLPADVTVLTNIDEYQSGTSSESKVSPDEPADCQVLFEAGHPAVIGRIQKTAGYLEAHDVRDSRYALKVTVSQELFATYTSQGGRIDVKKISLANGYKGQCYLVVLTAGKEMHIVALLSGDNRFTKAYCSWAESGTCPVAVENVHNGRLTFTELYWPSECVPDSNTFEPIKNIDRAGPWLTSDANILATAKDIALHDQLRISCHVSTALSECQWRRNRHISM